TADVRDRHPRIDCLDFASNRRKQSLRVLITPDDVNRRKIGALSEGNVHFRLGIDIQSEMAYITDDSHDRDPLRIGRHAPHYDAFAECILVRPELLSERLINDDDKWRIGLVRIGKKTTSDQWHRERTKIIRRDLAQFFIRARTIFV